MGIAAVYAVDADPGTTEGSQEIGCLAGGTTFSATETTTFEGRSTNFYAEDDALMASPIVVTWDDGRGYDAGAGNCGLGATVSMQSPGLRVGTTGLPILDLKFSDTPVVGAPVAACTGACDGYPAAYTELSVPGSLAGSVNLYSFSEAILGTFTYTMGSILAPSDVIVVDHTTAGGVAIPAGTYAGVITFTQS
jgi:hypothetical protein